MMKRRLLLFALALFACLTTGRVGAQTEEATPAATPDVPPSLASPAATLRTFIEAMNAEPADRDEAVSCLDLTEVTPDAGWPLAIRLFAVINKIEDVNFDRHPSADELTTPGGDPTVEYVFFPRAGLDALMHMRLHTLVEPSDRVVVKRTEDGWKFSANTVARIDAMYKALKDQPDAGVGLKDVAELSSAIWLERHLPSWAMDEVLGLATWQWIAIGLLVLLGLILDLIVRGIFAGVARRIIAGQRGEAQADTLKRTVRPFGLAAAALLWLWSVSALDLPAPVLAVLMPAVRFFTMLAMVWALFRVTDLVGEVAASKAETTDTKFDDLLVPLIRKTLKIVILIFGLIYIADSFHISIMPLLTGLGIGGVSFAFAAKDTLEHLFGSVTVIADRPFQVGDWVKIGDTEGVVEEVGFRSTRIRTFYNSEVTVPNGNLVRAVIDNYGRRKYRRWTTHLTITYGTPPDTIEAFCEGVRELIRLHPYTRKDYYQVWLHRFGAHSLDVLLYMFFECPDWNTELRERHRLMIDIIRLANRLGVEFAFPTQTLHMIRDEAGDTLTPPDAGQDVQAQRDGRAAVEAITANAEWRKGKPGPYRFRYAGVATTDDADDDTQIESKIGGDA